MNPEQLEQIKEDLAKQNITHYNTRQGNNCIIVNYGRVECYYLFDNNNQIANIIFD